MVNTKFTIYFLKSDWLVKKGKTDLALCANSKNRGGPGKWSELVSLVVTKRVTSSGREDLIKGNSTKSV